jgi:hypothetical protein
VFLLPLPGLLINLAQSPNSQVLEAVLEAVEHRVQYYSTLFSHGIGPAEDAEDGYRMRVGVCLLVDESHMACCISLASLQSMKSPQVILGKKLSVAGSVPLALISHSSSC